MNTLKYKTTLSCGGCVSKIEKLLNAEKNILKWEVDLTSADKILTVQTENLGSAVIPALLLKAGYKADLI